MTKSLSPTDTYLLPEELLPDISHLVTEDEAPLDDLPSEQEQQSKEAALQQAERERQSKEAAQQRAEQLTAQLRALGIEPDEFGQPNR